MTNNTKIQNVKEIIEAINLETKRAFQGLSVEPTLLEIIDEEDDALVIRGSNFLGFPVHKLLIDTCQNLNLFVSVSTRSCLDDECNFIYFPVLVLFS